MKVTQRQMKNAYLCGHFGKLVYVREKDCVLIGFNYIKYNIEHETIGKEKIMYYYGDLAIILQHNAKLLFSEDVEDIEQVEAML